MNYLAEQTLLKHTRVMKNPAYPAMEGLKKALVMVVAKVAHLLTYDNCSS